MTLDERWCTVSFLCFFHVSLSISSHHFILIIILIINIISSDLVISFDSIRYCSLLSCRVS